MGTLVSMETGHPVDSSSWECARISKAQRWGHTAVCRPLSCTRSPSLPHPRPPQTYLLQVVVSAGISNPGLSHTGQPCPHPGQHSPIPELGTSVGSPG